jgi:hypothetical protein
MKDSGARLCLSALDERLLQRDGTFTALRQTQESTAAALTDAIARPSRIEARFTRASAAPVWAAKATATPPAPPIPRQSAAPAHNLTPALGSTIISNFLEEFPFHTEYSNSH